MKEFRIISRRRSELLFKLVQQVEQSIRTEMVNLRQLLSGYDIQQLVRLCWKRLQTVVDRVELATAQQVDRFTENSWQNAFEELDADVDVMAVSSTKTSQNTLIVKPCNGRFQNLLVITFTRWKVI